MGKTLKTFLTLLAILILLSNQHVTAVFHKTLDPKSLGVKREKLTHLHFYFHDVVSGKNATTVRVAEAPTTNSSATGFGFVNIIDDPLTVGPDPNSLKIGSAQGIYASASQTELALLMVQNYVFTHGKYNGSTLSVLGHNPAFTAAERELAIVGGTGAFRFATGYAQARTHSIDAIRAIVEYNVYVLHY